MDDMLDISDGIKTDTKLDIKYKTIMGVEIPSVVMPEIEKPIFHYGLYNTSRHPLWRDVYGAGTRARAGERACHRRNKGSSGKLHL